ncbi:hypothetical protein NZK32_10780 [Cyanobium sp. FGCU-52]|nr:hypothetical protein [Cyanobium sp. FGCU52]
MLLALVLLLAIGPVRAQGPADGQPPGPGGTETLERCLGPARSLLLSGPLPYALVRLDGRFGFFLVDFGSDGSSVSPTTFLGGRGPTPLPGSSDRFAGFDFFGPWGPVRLTPQDHSGIRAVVPQAGLLGTDILARQVLTFDGEQALLRWAPPESFCRDATLRAAGFVPISSRGYFGPSARGLTCPAAPRRGGCPNIPTVPVRIGAVTAVAQVDTGYDDSRLPGSVNINTALLQRLQQAGIRLQRLPEADLTLSTCTGGSEPVTAWRLPAGASFEILGDDGPPALRNPDATLFVKATPAAAAACGGIGTWSRPAAQLGASFITAQRAAIFDPFTARIWLKPAAASGPEGR